MLRVQRLQLRRLPRVCATSLPCSVAYSRLTSVSAIAACSRAVAGCPCCLLLRRRQRQRFGLGSRDRLPRRAPPPSVPAPSAGRERVPLRPADSLAPAAPPALDRCRTSTAQIAACRSLIQAADVPPHLLVTRSPPRCRRRLPPRGVADCENPIIREASIATLQGPDRAAAFGQRQCGELMRQSLVQLALMRPVRRPMLASSEGLTAPVLNFAPRSQRLVIEVESLVAAGPGRP